MTASRFSNRLGGYLGRVEARMKIGGSHAWAKETGYEGSFGRWQRPSVFDGPSVGVWHCLVRTQPARDWCIAGHPISSMYAVRWMAVSPSFCSQAHTARQILRHLRIHRHSLSQTLSHITHYTIFILLYSPLPWIPVFGMTNAMLTQKPRLSKRTACVLCLPRYRRGRGNEGRCSVLITSSRCCRVTSPHLSQPTTDLLPPSPQRPFHQHQPPQPHNGYHLLMLPRRSCLPFAADDDPGLLGSPSQDHPDPRRAHRQPRDLPRRARD